LIQRIRGRRAFDRLSRDGKRIRRPALWCSWCPDSSSTTTSVAFALGRALGPAVTRNRLRRRLRALLREADSNRELPGGMLLLGAKPLATELTFEALRLEFRSMLPALTSAPVSTGTSSTMPTRTPATSPSSTAVSRP
jgi:ribonuclease P protein component